MGLVWCLLLALNVYILWDRLITHERFERILLFCAVNVFSLWVISDMDRRHRDELSRIRSSWEN